MDAETSLCARDLKRLSPSFLHFGGVGILPADRREACPATEGSGKGTACRVPTHEAAEGRMGGNVIESNQKTGSATSHRHSSESRNPVPRLARFNSSGPRIKSGVTNRVLILVLVMLLPILVCSRAGAKIEISLTDPNFVKIPIAVQDFVGQAGPLTGRILADIIKHDLYLTGLFQPVEIPQSASSQSPDFAAWSQAGAQFVITGVFQANGNEMVLEARLYDAALKKQEIAKRFTGKIPDHRRMVHRFADRVMEKLTGAEGCFSSKIAFAGEAPKEIYFMDFDGHNTYQLTRNGSINMSPDWSPDNRTILFTSYLNRNPDLWVLDMATLRQFPVSVRQGINASGRYSPDGSTVALSLSFKGIPKIFVITWQGNIINRLTNGRGNDISPTWSPDGSTIAYVSDGPGTPQIYTIPATGGEPKRLTFNNSNYNTDPDWSPKGDLIAFTARIDGRFQICTIKPDGTDFRVLTSVGQNQDPAWSPDGRMIAFTSDRDGRKLIYIMDTRGQIQERVSRVEGKGAAWSRNFK